MSERPKPNPPTQSGPKRLIGVRMDDRLIAGIDRAMASPEFRVPRTRQGLIRGVVRLWLKQNGMLT